MTENTDRLKRRKAAIKDELKRRADMTVTERQVYAATGRRPDRLKDEGTSATNRQVKAVLRPDDD